MSYLGDLVVLSMETYESMLEIEEADAEILKAQIEYARNERDVRRYLIERLKIEK